MLDRSTWNRLSVGKNLIIGMSLGRVKVVDEYVYHVRIGR